MVNESFDYNIQIESLREKMIDTAIRYGMNHPLVLKYSQDLDKMHNNILINNPKAEKVQS